MGAIRTEGMIEFGHDGSMLGTLTLPTPVTSSCGAVVFGLGVAEMQAARHFARLGIAALQVRLVKDSAQFRDSSLRNRYYDEHGVASFREAMDLLASRCGTSQFLLMGNCAGANLSFNTALQDHRVTGLILTNPHVSEVLTAGVLSWRRVLRKAAWRKLLTGRTNYRAFGSFAAAKLRGADDQALLSRWDYKKDVVLPLDFDRRLEALASERNLRALIVFSDAETSLAYFRRRYGATIDRLTASGRLRFEVMKTATHVFSQDDEAAQRLNQIVADWSSELRAA